LTRAIRALLDWQRIQPSMAPREAVIFDGRTPTETKRKLIRFWSENQTTLGMGLNDFTRRCVLQDDGKVVFQP